MEWLDTPEGPGTWWVCRPTGTNVFSPEPVQVNRRLDGTLVVTVLGNGEREMVTSPWYAGCRWARNVAPPMPGEEDVPVSCIKCRRPLTGEVAYQNGSEYRPVHPECKTPS